jgi:hypothetical protein
MNPIVISTISGASSFILTIFSAIYLNQRHVDMLIEQMEKRFDAKFDGIDAKFDGLRAEMRAEFGTVRAALGNLNQRVDRIGRQLEAIIKPVLPNSAGKAHYNYNSIIHCGGSVPANVNYVLPSSRAPQISIICGVLLQNRLNRCNIQLTVTPNKRKPLMLFRTEFSVGAGHFHIRTSSQWLTSMRPPPASSHSTLASTFGNVRASLSLIFRPRTGGRLKPG